jgi:hypothetical protein
MEIMNTFAVSCNKALLIVILSISLVNCLFVNRLLQYFYSVKALIRVSIISLSDFLATSFSKAFL